MMVNTQHLIMASQGHMIVNGSWIAGHILLRAPVARWWSAQPAIEMVVDPHRFTILTAWYHTTSYPNPSAKVA